MEAQGLVVPQALRAELERQRPLLHILLLPHDIHVFAQPALESNGRRVRAASLTCCGEGLINLVQVPRWPVQNPSVGVVREKRDLAVDELVTGPFALGVVLFFSLSCPTQIPLQGGLLPWLSVLLADGALTKLDLRVEIQIGELLPNRLFAFLS